MRDPVTLNKYLYANASPVMNIDPSGQYSLASVTAGIGTIGTLSTISTSAFAAGGSSGSKINIKIDVVRLYGANGLETRLGIDFANFIFNKLNKANIKITVGKKRVYPDFATIIYGISSELKNPVIVEDPFLNNSVLTAECG